MNEATLQHTSIHKFRTEIAGREINYYVGQTIKDQKITGIFRNEASFYEFGEIRYEVWATKDKEDDPYLFKVFVDNKELTLEKPKDDE